MKTDLLNSELKILAKGYDDYLDLKVDNDLPHLTFYEYCILYNEMDWKSRSQRWMQYK